MKILRKGPAVEHRIVAVREMTRADVGRLAGPRTPAQGVPKKLRNSHHNIARFAAAGLSNIQVAQRVGMTPERVGVLLRVPAMQELIAAHRTRIDHMFHESVDAYFDLATKNMVAAERHIADRISDLDDTEELLPVREALAISRDAADRFGYGKKSTNVNVNVDFAARLEQAIARSGKQVDEVKQLEATPPSRNLSPVVSREEVVPVSSSSLRRV